MEPMFVYPELEAHKPYRIITRDTPLAVCGNDLVYKPTDVDPEIALHAMHRDVHNAEEMPWSPKDQERRQEAIDRHFIEDYGGVSLCHQYIIARGIREGGIRLARHYRDFDGPTAMEVISWGAGIFRETKTDQDAPYEIDMGKNLLPKVTSRHMKVLLDHVVLTEDLALGENGEYTGETARVTACFESTNLILADSFGELEQLRDRHMERDFLQAYLDQLMRTTKFVRHSSSDVEAPVGIMQVSSSGQARAWTEHIGTGLWKAPPESVGELSERVYSLLENTLVDENPGTVITAHEKHVPGFR